MIGYAVTSSIAITAGAQSSHASLRSDFVRSETFGLSFGALAAEPGAVATSLLTAGSSTASPLPSPRPPPPPPQQPLRVDRLLEQVVELVIGRRDVVRIDVGGRVDRLLDRQREVLVGGRLARARRGVLDRLADSTREARLG